MTLAQAFKGWSMLPRNMILAKNSRDAVNKVLLKRFGDVHLEQFSPDLARRIFASSNEPQEFKTKAASILVHLLQWGGDHGYCKRPNFDYTIASNDVLYKEKEKKPIPKPIWELNGSSITYEPLVKVKLEALEKRKQQLAEQGMVISPMDFYDPSKKEQSKKKEDMTEKKTRCTKPRQVVQIDMQTLKPIKTWNSISEAERELGAKNVDRAIARKGVAKGFYWCNIGDEADFKPNSASEKQVIAEAKKKEKKAAVLAKKEPKTLQNERPRESVENNPSIQIPPQYKPYGMLPDGMVVLQEKVDITKFSDDELIAEIKRRGWKGNISITLNVEL